jgi:hypothetical protein
LEVGSWRVSATAVATLFMASVARMMKYLTKRDLKRMEE